MASVLKSPKITKRAVDAFKPAERERVVWDDDITGFGVRVHPSSAKAYLVNYRAGNGERKAPNKRVVVGRAGRMTPDQARRRAQELLGRAAAGEDPAGERTEARGCRGSERRARTISSPATGGLRARSGATGGMRRCISATGSRALWTASPAGTSRAASGFSPSGTERCPPTSACRSCVLCTGGRAWTLRVFGTLWSSGFLPGGATTGKRGNRYRLRWRCCRAGARGWRRRWGTRYAGTRSCSGSTRGYGGERFWRLVGSGWIWTRGGSVWRRRRREYRWSCR